MLEKRERYIQRPLEDGNISFCVKEHAHDMIAYVGTCPQDFLKLVFSVTMGEQVRSLVSWAYTDFMGVFDARPLDASIIQRFKDHKGKPISYDGGFLFNGLLAGTPFTVSEYFAELIMRTGPAVDIPRRMCETFMQNTRQFNLREDLIAHKSCFNKREDFKMLCLFSFLIACVFENKDAARSFLDVFKHFLDDKSHPRNKWVYGHKDLIIESYDMMRLMACLPELLDGDRAYALMQFADNCIDDPLVCGLLEFFCESHARESLLFVDTIGVLSADGATFKALTKVGDRKVLSVGLNHTRELIIFNQMRAAVMTDFLHSMQRKYVDESPSILTFRRRRDELDFEPEEVIRANSDRREDEDEGQ